MSHPAFQRWCLPVLFTLSGGAVTVIRTYTRQGLTPEALSYAIVWQYAILTVFCGGAVIALLARAKSRLWWEAVLILALFLGVWFTLLLLLPLALALLVAAGLTVATLAFRRVFLHDIFLLFGAFGVAINLAGWLPGSVLVMGLAAFTVYDTVAGAPHGIIVELTKSLLARQVIPGVILPVKPSDLALPISRALASPAVLLGAGDIILPLSLVASAAAKSGLVSALIVTIGIGFGATVLARRKDSQPRAALLPLAVGAAVPFLIMSFVRLI